MKSESSSISEILLEECTRAPHLCLERVARKYSINLGEVIQGARPLENEGVLTREQDQYGPKSIFYDVVLGGKQSTYWYRVDMTKLKEFKDKIKVNTQ